MHRLPKGMVSGTPAVTAIIAALVLSLPPALHAENLMVYIEVWDPDSLEQMEREDERLQILYFLSAVEAGIMEAFFEADYVVFNAGPMSGAEEGGKRSDAYVLTLARDGGADLLMRLAVRFEFLRNGVPQPDLGVLSYYRVDGGEQMLSDRMELADLIEGRIELSGEMGFKIGTEIARRVLDNS